MTDYDDYVNDLREFLAKRQISDALEAQAKEIAEKDARIAVLEAEIERLSNKKIISTDVTRVRIYNAIRAWTSAPDTVCSSATEAIMRIVNDHFGGLS